MKNACKQFNCKEKASIAKLYNKKGVAIYEDDIEYTKAGDVLYLALNGKEINPKISQTEQAFWIPNHIGEAFSNSAILDDYEIIKKIGQGGFGSVMLGKNRDTNKEVAIKYMDMSE